MTARSTGRRYHRGDLPQALIETSFDLLAETGLGGFSVAQVARRLSISTAAPYRHYADRDHLLAAVATAAARELSDRIRAALEATGPDPADRFAASAAAYVRFAGTRRAGFDVIFAAGLEELGDTELAGAGRELMDLLLGLAEATGHRPTKDSLRLLEAHMAAAHGYASLYTGGFFARGAYTLDELAERAAGTSRALVLGTPPARPRS